MEALEEGARVALGQRNDGDDAFAPAMTVEEEVVERDAEQEQRDADSHHLAGHSGGEGAEAAHDLRRGGGELRLQVGGCSLDGPAQWSELGGDARERARPVALQAVRELGSFDDEVARGERCQRADGREDAEEDERHDADAGQATAAVEAAHDPAEQGRDERRQRGSDEQRDEDRAQRQVRDVEQEQHAEHHHDARGDRDERAWRTRGRGRHRRRRGRHDTRTRSTVRASPRFSLRALLRFRDAGRGVGIRFGAC